MEKFHLNSTREGKVHCDRFTAMLHRLSNHLLRYLQRPQSNNIHLPVWLTPDVNDLKDLCRLSVWPTLTYIQPSPTITCRRMSYEHNVERERTFPTLRQIMLFGTAQCHYVSMHNLSICFFHLALHFHTIISNVETEFLCILSE